MKHFLSIEKVWFVQIQLSLFSRIVVAVLRWRVFRYENVCRRRLWHPVMGNPEVDQWWWSSRSTWRNQDCLRRGLLTDAVNIHQLQRTSKLRMSLDPANFWGPNPWFIKKLVPWEYAGSRRSIPGISRQAPAASPAVISYEALDTHNRTPDSDWKSQIL